MNKTFTNACKCLRTNLCLQSRVGIGSYRMSLLVPSTLHMFYRKYCIWNDCDITAKLLPCAVLFVSLGDMSGCWMATLPWYNTIPYPRWCIGPPPGRACAHRTVVWGPGRMCGGWRRSPWAGVAPLEGAHLGCRAEEEGGEEGHLPPPVGDQCKVCFSSLFG